MRASTTAVSATPQNLIPPKATLIFDVELLSAN